MSTQVDRLQALLLRVQHNRAKPRAAGAAAMQREASQVAARPQPPAAVSAREAPAPEPTRSQGRPEMREPPTASVPRPAPAEPRTRPAVETASARPNVPAVSHAVSPDQPRTTDQPRIIDPAPAQPSRPVAQVVSKHPQPVASTFGELLRRSLALRPR